MRQAEEEGEERRAALDAQLAKAHEQVAAMEAGARGKELEAAAALARAREKTFAAALRRFAATDQRFGK